MRLTWKRMTALAAIAAAGLMPGCSADSPGPTGTPNPGPGSNGLAITVQANPTNPVQGNCSVVTVTATQNGAPVPSGTPVTLSASFGTFAQNGLQTISLETTNGTALTAICSNTVGPSTVTGHVTVGGKTATGQTTVNFQSNGVPTGPFISICANPHTGTTAGGDTIQIQGGGFGTNPANVRVLFRSGGVVHQGIVTAVTDSSITVTTPAFPELAGLPATPVEVDVLLNGQTLASPACFTYTTAAQPVVSAILPASGTKLGGTRVTIVGSGFQAPVQVFFGGTLEAQVVSVSPTQIIAITPPANAQGPDTAFPQNVDVVVKEVNCSGSSCTSGPVTYTYTVGMKIFAFTPDHGDSTTTVTITGQGFVAPLIVTFGGVQGTVVSVTGTQILAKPPAGCPTGGTNPGAITVTLLSDGETATSPTNFRVTTPQIVSQTSPTSGPGGVGTTVTVVGTDLFPTGQPGQVSILAGGGAVTGVSASEVNGQQTITFTVTPDVCSPTVTLTFVNTATGCTAAATAFQNNTFTDAGPTVTMNSPVPGGAGSMKVTYSASATGGTAPYTFVWSFGSTGSPTPATHTDSGITAGQTDSVVVTYNCSGCTVDPASVQVTDKCGHVVGTNAPPATTP